MGSYSGGGGGGGYNQNIIFVYRPVDGPLCRGGQAYKRGDLSPGF